MEKLDAIAALGRTRPREAPRYLPVAGASGSRGDSGRQIGERLGLPSATLSFHLKELKQAKLVTFRRERRSLIYMAAYPTMKALLGYLTENCCQGDAAACGIGVCDPHQ